MLQGIAKRSATIMLTIRFTALRDLHDPLSAATSATTSDKSGGGVFDDDSIAVRWAVQTRHGSQECRTRYVKLSTTDDESTKVWSLLSGRYTEYSSSLFGFEVNDRRKGYV